MDDAEGKADEKIYWGNAGLRQAAEERLNRPKAQGGFANREQLERTADWLQQLTESCTEAEISERLEASGLTPEEVQEAVYELSYRAGRQRFLASRGINE